MRTVLAIAALAALAAPAAAATPENQSITVGTSDLDLSSPGGRSRLKARVGRAADKVCDRDDSRDLGAQSAFRTCRDAAMRDALGD